MLLEFGPSVVSSCELDPPAGRLFLAESRVRGLQALISMIFGDRELEVRTSVHPYGRPWALELGYYLEAMGMDSEPVRNSMWINDEKRLGAVLRRQATGLRECLRGLDADADALWYAAEATRQQAIRSARARMRRRETRVAVHRAREAFGAGQYRRVVALLTPYEDILSDAQRRRLNLAESRLRPPER